MRCQSRAARLAFYLCQRHRRCAAVFQFESWHSRAVGSNGQSSASADPQLSRFTHQSDCWPTCPRSGAGSGQLRGRPSRSGLRSTVLTSQLFHAYTWPSFLDRIAGILKESARTGEKNSSTSLWAQWGGRLLGDEDCSDGAISPEPHCALPAGRYRRHVASGPESRSS